MSISKVVPVKLVLLKLIAWLAVNVPPVAILKMPALSMPLSSIAHVPLVVKELPFLTINTSPEIISVGLVPVPSVLVPHVVVIFALPEALE